MKLTSAESPELPVTVTFVVPDAAPVPTVNEPATVPLLMLQLEEANSPALVDES